MQTRLLILVVHVFALVLASCAQSPIEESGVLDDALDGEDEPTADDDDGTSVAPSEEVELDDDEPSRGDDLGDDEERSDEEEMAPSRPDAGMRDAATLPGSGSSAVVRQDAATPTSPAARDGGSTPVRDAAVPSAPSSGEGCRSSTDCRNSCFPIGIAPCCRANRTCGCSWAPGAYCL